MQSENNTPSWLVPPTQTSEIYAKPNQQPIPASNPSWLTPPTPINAASTHAPPVLPIRLQVGRKPTSEEWKELQAAIKKNPDRRLQIGARHHSIQNLVFLRYHSSYINGEMWGTKEQLVETRGKRKASVKRWRDQKAINDPEWKAERDAKLKALSERQKIRLAASKEAAEEARYGNSRRAKAYRKRRAEKEACDAEARAERLQKRREARASLPKIIP